MVSKGDGHGRLSYKRVTHLVDFTIWMGDKGVTFGLKGDGNGRMS